MKIHYLWIPLLIFICACSNQSTFEKDMRSGKDAFKAKQFKESIHFFEDALIEKPTDKDAPLLLERAKQENDLVIASSLAVNYQKEVRDVITFLEEKTAQYDEKFFKNRTGIRLQEMADIEVIKNHQLLLSELRTKYKENKTLTQLNSELELATTALMRSLERIDSGILVRGVTKMHLENVKSSLSELIK